MTEKLRLTVEQFCELLNDKIGGEHIWAAGSDQVVSLYHDEDGNKSCEIIDSDELLFVLKKCFNIEVTLIVKRLKGDTEIMLKKKNYPKNNINTP